MMGIGRGCALSRQRSTTGRGCLHTGNMQPHPCTDMQACWHAYIPAAGTGGLRRVRREPGSGTSTWHRHHCLAGAHSLRHTSPKHWSRPGSAKDPKALHHAYVGACIHPQSAQAPGPEFPRPGLHSAHRMPGQGSSGPHRAALAKGCPVEAAPVIRLPAVLALEAVPPARKPAQLLFPVREVASLPKPAVAVLPPAARARADRIKPSSAAPRPSKCLPPPGAGAAHPPHAQLGLRVLSVAPETLPLLAELRAGVEPLPLGTGKGTVHGCAGIHSLRGRE